MGVKEELDKATVNIAGVEGKFMVAGVKGTLEDEVELKKEHDPHWLVIMAGSKGKELFHRPLHQLKLCQKRLSFPPRALLTN